MARAVRLAPWLAAAALIMVPTAHAAFPGANGRIYFDTGRGDPVGFDDIWSFNPDGSDARPLVQSPAGDFEPAVSADGREIVFVSDRDGGDDDIFAINADGTNFRQLTKNDSIDDLQPAWSPDGTRIVFQSVRNGTDTDIYTMSSVDGSDVQPVTSDTVNEDNPAWSPDGTRIAFTKSGAGGPNDIWTIAPTGGPTTNLTNSSGVGETHPNWSPDGTKLAYDSDGDVFVVNTNGTGAHAVANSTDDEQRPDWSPDGAKIAYAREVPHGVANTDQVFVVGPDGSSPTNISNTVATGVEDFDSDWAVAVPPPPSTPVVPPKFTGLFVRSQTVRVTRKGVAAISVSCPQASGVACAGSLTLRTATAVVAKHKVRRRVLTLGRAKFSLAAGKGGKVRVKLSKRGLKVLRAKHSLRTSATVVTHDPSAAQITVRVGVKLKAPKARRHHR